MISSTHILHDPPPPLWRDPQTGAVHLRATLLGREEGHIRCPRVHRLALSFGQLDPLALMEKLLRAAGFSRPEELRPAFAIPAGRLIATPLPDSAERLDTQAAPQRQVLEQALMLGLCTQYLYDPGRPVLWTRTSLQRGLELFDPAGFYA